MWRGSREGPGPTCVREAARQGASTSLWDPRLVCPALPVRVPGSPALGQGLAAPPRPTSGEIPRNARARPRARGPRKTTGRRYRLSRKVSVSAGRAHGNSGVQGRRGFAARPKPGEGGGSQPSPARSSSSGSSAHPNARLSGLLRGERVCVLMYWGHSPSREPMQSPRPPLGLGIPSPSAEIPARPLPTLPRRESGRAGDKETPTSSTLGPSARPRHSPAPSLDPATSRVDTSEKGGGQGCESAPRCWPAGGCPCSLPGDTPPAAHQTVPGPRCGPPGPNRPPPLQLSDRGARRTQSGLGCVCVESTGGERSRRGTARPGAAIYPISSSISEMSAKMRQTTSSVSAASIQLRNCSCMVASRPRDRAGWSEERGWRAQRRAPEPPRARCAAGQIPCAPGESGPAAAAATAAHRGCSGAASQLSPSAPARPFSPPPLPFLLLPFPALRGAPRAQFDSFAPRLCSPPPTPVPSDVQPPALAYPACLLSAPRGALGRGWSRPLPA